MNLLLPSCMPIAESTPAMDNDISGIPTPLERVKHSVTRLAHCSSLLAAYAQLDDEQQRGLIGYARYLVEHQREAGERSYRR
ncbi:MAG TPA: hypothetical protein VF583_28405 [Bradyrhizobium sp.]